MSKTEQIRRQWLRRYHQMKSHPNHWVRKGFGLLIMVAGLLGPFVPVLGIWMFPFGLILFFSDSPIYWRWRRKFVGWRRRRRQQRQHDTKTGNSADE
ncbi:MAG: hypothetical protein OEZ10_10860 [Gammaproteobacteria bacterium]|nr:hypothetical protein [Gammaproteobacteria bacterium]